MLIRVKVFPNSNKREIIEKAENSFEIKVQEKPQNNLANEQVMEILASYFKITENSVKLIKGRKQRSKIFEIKNNEEKI
ncbi:MAG: DUF167 domain-containing protein [Patescibacteria group bacterium]|nr:DUF167 domain-containing protein [Patescibacteria group bacterium]